MSGTPSWGRRALITGGLMVGAAGLAEVLTPRRLMAQEQPLPPLEQLFALNCEGWVGSGAPTQMLVSPDVRAVLATLYQQTLTRIYTHPRQGAVMLAAAYGGDQSDATRAHRPEVCYPAQGFTVHDVHRAVLTLGPAAQPRTLRVRRLQARLGTRHEPMTYWINTGGTVATSGLEQKLAQMREGLRGVVPDGLLVRVSTLDRDAPRGWRVQRQFLDALYRSTPVAWRHRLFGREDQP